MCVAEGEGEGARSASGLTVGRGGQVEWGGGGVDRGRRMRVGMLRRGVEERGVDDSELMAVKGRARVGLSRERPMAAS